MATQIKFSAVQVLKGIGLALPIIAALVAGYLNIMVKLTSLEEKLTFGQQQYISLTEQVREVKNQNIVLQKELQDHMLKDKKQ